MIEFQNPNILMLLAVIPLVIIIHFFSLVYFSRHAQKFANFETLRRMNNKKKVFSKKIPQLIIRIMFVVILVFAASGPFFWMEKEGVAEKIIFAVDTSGSMLAEDIEPNRLGATREGIISFLESQDIAINVGLITFTSFAYPELYPTTDKDIFINKLRGVDIRSSSGTSVGQAINHAVALLGEESQVERRIIIFTDGRENILNDAELSGIVENAVGKGISIYSIGVGTFEGGRIGDLSGEFVISEETLELIKDVGGGDYRIAFNSDEIQDALSDFTTMDSVKVKFELSFWLYILAFFVLILEWYFANLFFRSFP